ncbi:MAG: hypothetical protein NC319_02080 [Butyricicoccus sp.]|nr:hypothetical protein [Butyricicoccus sp.]
MDKSNQRTYCSGNELLIVERYFTGNKSIEEIVKQYMSEQMKKMSGLDESDNVQYSYSSEKAVVASAKEDGK